MSNRKIYNQIGAFISSNNSSGYYFIDFSGNQTPNLISTQLNGSLGYSYNSINPLIRVFDVSYGFGVPRTDLKQIGSYGTIGRPIVSNPIPSLKISYYSAGAINESRIGLTLDTPLNGTGAPIYGGNPPSIISGLNDRNYSKDYSNYFIDLNGNSIYWLNSTREAKSIFVCTNSSPSDLNYLNSNSSSLNGTSQNTVGKGVYTYGFGNCYLDSYKFSASVGQFPYASVSYTCENIIFLSGSTGVSPYIEPNSGNYNNTSLFSIPPVYTGASQSVLIPGDIKISISQNNSNSITSLFDFQDIKIQSFDLSLDLNRDVMSSLGYILPLDRQINPPVMASISVSAIIGDSFTGSLSYITNKDYSYDYNISIASERFTFITGSALIFNIRGAKLNNIQVSDGVSNLRTLSFQSSVEINPYSNSQGVFASGQMGVPYQNYPIY